jgi:hypothetical protein
MVNILEIDITPEMIAVAKESAKQISSLNNSITKGEAALWGKLGEAIVAKAYPQNRPINTYNYDMIIDGHRVEVKTHRTTAIPKPHYYAHIPEFNQRQETDAYMFCRVLYDMSKGWILGYLEPQELRRRAQRVEKGEEINFGFRAHCNSLVVTVAQMNRITKGTGRFINI